MKIRSALLLVAGILLLLCALAHGFGWGQFADGLADVSDDVRHGLRVGWLWGSATFAALGAVVLASQRRWTRGGVDPRPTVGPIAVVLLGFGLWATFARGFSPHFLLFVTLGVLTGAPLVGPFEDP